MHSTFFFFSVYSRTEKVLSREGGRFDFYKTRYYIAKYYLFIFRFFRTLYKQYRQSRGNEEKES